MPIDIELEKGHAKEIGQLQAEVHTLNTLVTKLFEKFDLLVEKLQPKQLGVAGYIGIALSIMTIFALLFGSMIYMTSSANAPISAQMAQIAQTLASIQNSTIQASSNTQLLSKELSGLGKSVENNNNTLEWMIFQENLPKQITETQGRLNTLEMQMTRLVNGIHNKGK